MYYDYKVCYATEESFNTAMKSRGILEEVTHDEVTELVPTDIALGVVRIGTIWETLPVYDVDGNEETPGVPVAGYHADLRLSVEQSFGDKEMTPTNPVHKFL